MFGNTKRIDTAISIAREIREDAARIEAERQADRATIARLTAERDEARADVAAAYDRAAAAISETTALAEIVKKAVDAETRACAEVVRSAIPNIPPDGPTNDECRIVYEELGGAMTAILARLDQRKEAE